MDFVFHLGFNEDLAKLELETVLGKAVTKISPRKYLVELDNFSDLNTVAHRLGGLVEIRGKSNDKLVWRHQAKEWYKRDRLKPFADGRKGMLPPKIARIMINLALGKNYTPDQVLLDPFCGSGNILMEASVLGLSLLGTDIDTKQLEGTRKNLNWLGIKNFKLHNFDATQISKNIDTQVNYIVTEPFMGKPNLRPDRIKFVTKGLHKLYLGSLKNWLKVLDSGGTVCMVFPIYSDGKKTYQLSEVIDDKSLVGYNVKTRGLIYSRPNSKLKREIVVLKKK
ncbi:methyltransferase domain-containing protein [Patescibacteria group bacterium]|nr:methyltransferase domain-containing protein [Patescibacteria group bacterium]